MNGVDLTADGADRFLVDVTIEGSGVNVYVQFGVWDGAANVAGIDQDFTTSGTYEFAFSDFSGSADWTDIWSIRLRPEFFATGSTPVEFTLTLDNLRTAPEPATCGLLALGLGLWVSRRHR